MLTKIGGQIKEAFIIGGLRAARLTPGERRVIEKEHGMKPNSNIVLRNMGRDMAGSTAGTLAGRSIGAVAGAALGRNEGSTRAGADLGGMVGSWGGSWLASNKYSKGAVQKIIERNAEKGQR